MRTWPAFWVVLAAYFLFPTSMGGDIPPALWRFLTFAQNFGLHYLSHKAVFNIVGNYSDQFKLSGAFTLIIATSASIACGALLYSLVEMPFMTLRDRLFPSLFHRKEEPRYQSAIHAISSE
jgi:peptidoglycan/LPS O-acetylase OafA/YrhL